MKPQQFAAYAITQLGLALVATCLFVVSPPVFAATPQEAAWSGQATCAVNVQSPGYSYQATQTWTITPGAPTMQGQMQVYPASWSASGNGATQRPQGAQALQATWNSTVPGISAPIAVFFRGYDKRLIIKAWHSQLRQQASIRGTRLVSAAGAAPTQSALVSDAYEWQFQTVESDPTGTTVSGSGTVEVGGGYLLLQPTMASTKAACQWEFVKGAPSPAQLPADEPNSGPTSLPPASASPANPTQNLGSTSVSSIPVPQPPAAVPMMSQPTISQPMISQPMTSQSTPSQPTVPTTSGHLPAQLLNGSTTTLGIRPCSALRSTGSIRSRWRCCSCF